jgi:2-iminobutanoate/2-iminopropanoate deaminase
MSRAVRSESAPETLFSAGQIPIEPSTGELVRGGVAEQTRQVLENLGAVLRAGGLGLGDVVKTTVYMTNLKDFGSMNEVYAGYFREPFPARTTVETSGLPKGALVEIDVVAVRED